MCLIRAPPSQSTFKIVAYGRMQDAISRQEPGEDHCPEEHTVAADGFCLHPGANKYV